MLALVVERCGFRWDLLGVARAPLQLCFSIATQTLRGYAVLGVWLRKCVVSKDLVSGLKGVLLLC